MLFLDGFLFFFFIQVIQWLLTSFLSYLYEGWHFLDFLGRKKVCYGTVGIFALECKVGCDSKVSCFPFENLLGFVCLLGEKFCFF